MTKKNLDRPNFHRKKRKEEQEHRRKARKEAERWNSLFKSFHLIFKKNEKDD